MPDRTTIAFYDARAAEYAGFASRNQIDEARTSFTHLFPFGGRILDLGCGAGQDSAFFRDQGLSVTSVDASAELAEQAKNLWHVDVVCMDMQRLTYKRRFDAVWANASLHHLHPGALPNALARIRRALRPRGLLWAQLKCNDKSTRDEFGRYFAAVDERRMLNALHKSGEWRLIAMDRRRGHGFDGKAVDWLRVVVEKG